MSEAEGIHKLKEHFRGAFTDHIDQSYIVGLAELADAISADSGPPGQSVVLHSQTLVIDLNSAVYLRVWLRETRL